MSAFTWIEMFTIEGWAERRTISGSRTGINTNVRRPWAKVFSCAPVVAQISGIFEMWPVYFDAWSFRWSGSNELMHARLDFSFSCWMFCPFSLIRGFRWELKKFFMAYSVSVTRAEISAGVAIQGEYFGVCKKESEYDRLQVCLEAWGKPHFYQSLASWVVSQLQVKIFQWPQKHFCEYKAQRRLAWGKSRVSDGEFLFLCHKEKDLLDRKSVV